MIFIIKVDKRRATAKISQIPTKKDTISTKTKTKNNYIISILKSSTPFPQSLRRFRRSLNLSKPILLISLVNSPQNTAQNHYSHYKQKHKNAQHHHSSHTLPSSSLFHTHSCVVAPAPLESSGAGRVDSRVTSVERFPELVA